MDIEALKALIREAFSDIAYPGDWCLNFRMAGVIEPGFVEQVRQAGLKVYVWTVSTQDEARQAAAAGVDGITTDRPGWLRELLDDPLP